MLTLTKGQSLSARFTLIKPLGLGGMGALNALIVAETFGIKAFGSIMGMITMAGIFPHLAGPLVAGALFDG